MWPILQDKTPLVMSTRRFFYSILFITFTLSSNFCFGQSQEKAYAIFMLSFARGIQWPESSYGTFTIGVLAYPPLVAELNQVFNSTKLGNRKVEIREYTSADEIDKCQMLFIPAFKTRSFENILTKVGTQPTLIFTNKVDMAKKGAGVNFVFAEGKLKYEINCKTIEKRGMKIPANIKGLGILVE